MLKQSFRLIFIALIAGFIPPLQASTSFNVRAFYDTQVANDPSQGPDATDGGSGTHVRDIGTRRRVTLVSFDLSEVKQSGVVFQDVTLSVISNSGSSIDVYGILEDFDNLGENPLTWNSAPGVQNNPTLDLDTAVALNLDEAVFLFTFSGLPGGDNRGTSEPSAALSDFMSTDTDGIITLMFAPQEGGSAILRSSVRWNNDAAGTFLEGSVGGVPKGASKPVPSNALTDVERDQDLTWNPGAYAVAHNVYMSTSYDEVNDASAGALIADHHDVNRLAIDRLEFGTTYYWRVDEVNGTPDQTTFTGPIWNFTVEPKSYILSSDSIVAEASSNNNDTTNATNTINQSGLVDGLHDSDENNMWLSKAQEADDPQTTVTYTFDKVYQLDTLKVWNYNTSSENIIGWGIKEVEVQYTLDGETWSTFDAITQFAKAGSSTQAEAEVFELNGLAASAVKFVIVSNWGGFFKQYGLSEVQFLYIPVSARYPYPEANAVDVNPFDTLNWRAGREADEHVLSVGLDPNDTTSNITSDTSVAMSDLDLQLGQTYYWMVDEVNEAETPSTYQGDLWSFTTTDHLVIDDFESYNNDAVNYKRVFQNWIDGAGYTNPVEFPGNGTGSFVGYNPEFGDIMEMDETHSGSKSAPFYFSSAGSQIDRTFEIPQDWTKAGVTSLVLYFFGSDSSTGQLYMIINNEKIMYEGDAANLSTPLWTQWTIDLSEVNTDLTSVTNMSIGVDGNADGMILLDDILLYAVAPIPPSQIWIEAESGTIEAPMTQYTDNADASGGTYVTVQLGYNSTEASPAEGKVSYSFEVEVGTYTVDCRHISPSGTEDSLWFRIPGATINRAIDADVDGWIRSSLSTSSDWSWSTLNSMADSSGIVEFTLETGTHTLEVTYREDGALLDAFTIKSVE